MKTMADAETLRHDIPPVLRVADPGDSLVEPGRVVLRFLADGVLDGTPVEYRFRDYDGNLTGATGKVEVRAGQILIQADLTPGFHEVEFSVRQLRFGVVALPDYTGITDDFWGVNSILMVKSWKKDEEFHAATGAEHQYGQFKKPDGMEKYLKLLRRCGIRQIREMAGFFKRAPQENVMNYNIDMAGDINDLALRHDLRILTFYAHFSEWLGTVRRKGPASQRQVVRLEKLAGPYGEMLRCEAPSAAGVQVFNEGDHSNTPPDGTMSLTWLTRYLVASNRLKTPVVGMGFAGAGPDGHGFSDHIFRLYAENGMLDAVDAVAFHNYVAPETLTAGLADCIAIMSRYSGRLPALWITECGKPWRAGPPRAAIAEDICSANWIVRKAVEAKAFGIGRFYVFCLPYFEEGVNNFGLFDYHSTPQRSFAALITAVQKLSGFHYVGDLKELPAGVSSGRVFADGRHAVAVLCGSAATISPGRLPCRKFIGIDGSNVALDDRGNIKLTGGLLYAELSLPLPAKLLNSETPAMHGNRILTERYSPATKVYPVVFRHHFEDFERGSTGYYPKQREFDLKVTAFNLSGEPQAVIPRLERDGRSNAPINDSSDLIPGGGQREYIWPFMMGDSNAAEVKIRDMAGNSPQLSLRFQYLGDSRRIAGADRAVNWRKNASGAMTITDDFEQKAVKFSILFASASEHWAYPKFNLRLPPTAVAISYEIRTDATDAAAGFTNGGFYIWADKVPRTQSQINKSLVPTATWQTRVIRLDEDPSAIRTIGIGCNPKADKAVFYIRNLRFY